MITHELAKDLDRLAAAGAFQPPMLMLGAQGCTLGKSARAYFGKWVGKEYQELDLDGGDLQIDLNHDLVELGDNYATVFNLGTLEHVWDLHQAWVNALRAVRVGGVFVTHSPVTGWRDGTGALNHGLHLTLADAIVGFIAKNGFAIRDQWTTQFRDRGKILWLRAEKREHLASRDDFEPPLQAYVRGKRPEKLG